MRKLRISAISFLNTAPLMWDFEKGQPPPAAEARTGGDCPVPGGAGELVDPALRQHFEVEYTIPSQCAEALSAGTADIGIVPVVAYATNPGLVIVPDVAIAARGPVRSILLVSKVPREEISTLAADKSSRTSVALARVLFHRWRVRVPQFVSAEPQLDSMLASCDAALLIGDRALQVDRSCYLTWDLAQEWRQLTGRPFVFAFWAVRVAALREASRELDVAAVFQRSRDHGLEPSNLAVIARGWSSHVGLQESDIRDYLTRNIHYNLDDECLAGMELFFRYAAQCGGIPAVPSLRFMGSLRSALTAL